MGIKDAGPPLRAAAPTCAVGKIVQEPHQIFDPLQYVSNEEVCGPRLARRVSAARQYTVVCTVGVPSQMPLSIGSLVSIRFEFLSPDRVA